MLRGNREALLREVQKLSPLGVLLLGTLNEQIVRRWTAQVDGNLEVVLTGPNGSHYPAVHPDMVNHEGNILDAIVDPDEVHRNRNDPDIAHFFRAIGNERCVRVTVVMQQRPGAYKHSIITARRARVDEVRRGRNRIVWKKG